MRALQLAPSARPVSQEPSRRQIHDDRMLAYAVCAVPLVLPLAMAPVNACFAHLDYRVSERTLAQF